jgi:hypothetical protein
MQKFWSRRGKRSQPLPTEDHNGSSPTTQEADQENTDTTNSSENRLKSFRFLFQNSQKTFQENIASKFSASGMFFFLGIGGVIFAAILGIYYLAAPESTPDSNLACTSKINGDWQTSLGKLTLEEKGNENVLGKYDYSNFERGYIMGEFIGKLHNNVITFDWHETSLQHSKQNGKGVLVFSENCKEFYGSYGTGESTNNFGNWQGTSRSK